MFDYRILENNKSKHKAVEKIIMFQYYMDIIIQAIKDNDLKTLNEYRLYKIYEMLEEYDFLLDTDL